MIAPAALWIPVPWIQMVGALATGAVVLTAAILRVKAGRPFTAPASCVALLRAALKVGRRGSVVWRGTSYEVEALRGQQRVRL